MSPGNGYEQDFNLQRLRETIDAKIGEDAEKIETFFSSAFIYKVPEELRKLKKSAYTPRLIAIGPLHCNDKHLKTPMQYVKGSYTDCLLSRLITEEVTDNELAKQKRYRILEECLAKMKLLLDGAKKYYAEECLLNEEMLLLDGCFIIELLYRCYLKCFHGGGSGNNSKASSRTKLHLKVQGSTNSSSNGKTTDPIFHSILTANTVQLDLLLLENQIPFFVLEKLFDLTIDKIPNRLVIKMKNQDDEGFRSSTGHQYYHILHKLHDDYHPWHQIKKTDLSERMSSHQMKKTCLSELLPSASNLEYAGVKFVPGTGKDPFNVKFTKHQGLSRLWRRAVFEIPTLSIYDPTEAFLRNMIAFEQCCPGASQLFTSYAYLMNMLVNFEKDVERLEKAEVMRNYLGANEDAKNLFNKLCNETTLGEFFFADC